MRFTLPIRAALTAALLCCAGAWAADPYPSKPLRVIIPFPAGGPTDVVGRLLAQKLAEQVGQSVVIENRAGGNGTIGPMELTRSAPDGYTLMFTASTFTTTSMVSKDVTYDVAKDFTPIALVAKGPLAVGVTNGMPAKNIAELLAHAKTKQLSFAVGSIGSAGHLATEEIKRSGSLDFLIVPYKGSTPAYQDLIGGQIDGFVDPLLGALPYHKGNRIRVLAVTSKERLAALPDVPTVGETIKGFEFYTWYGLWGPPNMPKELSARLNAEVNKALSSPLGDKLLGQGYLLSPGTPEDFARFQSEDMARSKTIITAAKIRME